MDDVAVPIVAPTTPEMILWRSRGGQRAFAGSRSGSPPHFAPGKTEAVL